MLRLAILLVTLAHTRTAYVTNAPSFTDRLEKLNEKLEKLTIAAHNSDDHLQSTRENLLEKLDRLNAITPEHDDLTVDDEELLSAMQMWAMMSPEQLDGVTKELQSVRDVDSFKNRLESDESYDESDMPFYPVDWDQEDESEPSSTSRPSVVTPSELNKVDYRETVISAVDPIAATNERPKILDDSGLPPAERMEIKQEAFQNIAAQVRQGRIGCSQPQPRWYSVRQLAPAANIVYMPPCVQLHRCAPDSGCCHDEAEVFAPIAGNYIPIAFWLHKAEGDSRPVRMLFFNHTECACVSRDTLQTTVRSKIEAPKPDRPSSEGSRERQNDWRISTEEPHLDKEEDRTAPPQLRRCTCPALFIARPLSTGACTCTCDWPEAARRRDCLSLARGREHFGMRDRVCIDSRDCAPPACEYGAYERAAGRCPLRRYRPARYHHRVRH